MKDNQLTELQLTIKQVLDSWRDTQLNLASDSARVLLSLAIAEELERLSATNTNH
jgi:hypothetical protein